MAIDARGLEFPLVNGGRVKYDLEYDSTGDLYRFKGKPPEVIKILDPIASDVFFDSGNDYEPVWFDSSALNGNYGDQAFFDVTNNKNFVILSSAITGDCLDEMNDFVGYVPPVLEYAIRGSVGDDTHITFSSNLLSGATKWAVEFQVSNYAGANQFITPIGDRAGDPGSIYWEAGQQYFGFVNDSGIDDTNNVVSEAILITALGGNFTWFAWSDGTNVYYYAADVLRDTLTPPTGGTAFTLNTLIRGASSGLNTSDGDFHYLKVWDNPTGNDKATIEAETPTHYFKFNEGTGTSLSDEQSAVTGTIVNPHAGVWQLQP